MTVQVNPDRDLWIPLYDSAIVILNAYVFGLSLYNIDCLFTNKELYFNNYIVFCIDFVFVLIPTAKSLSSLNNHWCILNYKKSVLWFAIFDIIHKVVYVLILMQQATRKYVHPPRNQYV